MLTLKYGWIWSYVKFKVSGATFKLSGPGTAHHHHHHKKWNLYSKKWSSQRASTDSCCEFSIQQLMRQQKRSTWTSRNQSKYIHPLKNWDVPWKWMLGRSNFLWKNGPFLWQTCWFSWGKVDMNHRKSLWLQHHKYCYRPRFPSL